MWKVRRAVACAASLRRWCAVKQDARACACVSNLNPTRQFSTSGIIPLDGSVKLLGSTNGYSFSSSRGFATRVKGASAHDDSASEVEDSDEFESEADDLKAFVASEASEHSDDGTEEDSDEEEGAAAGGPEEAAAAAGVPAPKTGSMSLYERRQNLIRLDNLQQELWRRTCLLKKSDHMKEMLDQWKKEGNDLTATMVTSIVDRLKTSNRFTHALQVIEYARKDKSIGEFRQASALLIEVTARAKGIAAGEKVFEDLPEAEKSRLAYCAMLARYVYCQLDEKAEALFEEMEKLGYVSDSPFALNLMMKLYKQKDDTVKFQQMLAKAQDIAVQPNIYTYNVMLELKARTGDLEGMEKIFKEIKTNPGMAPDCQTHTVLAKAYMRAGMPAHAELNLLRIEIGHFKKAKSNYEFLMASYGQLVLPDDVERMWQKCKAIPGDGFSSFLVLQRAMAMAGEVERVESMYKRMDSWKRSMAFELKRHNNLLLVYYKAGLKDKAKEQEKKMFAARIKNILLPADKLPLPKFASKAEQILKVEKPEKKTDKVDKIQLKKTLEKAADVGDVKAAEVAFEVCRKAGLNRVSVWNRLLKAYVKAEVPAYGFLERMKAEKVEPNEETETLLKELKSTVAA